jgi:hypothetical protein
MGIIFKKNKNAKSEISRYFAIKPLYSNYFFQDLVDVETFATEQTFLVKKNDNSVSRIYYVSNDLDDLKSILKSLSEGCVVNIPSKTDISFVNELLLECGFYLNATYERFFYDNIQTDDFFSCQYADFSSIEWISEKLSQNFDAINDRLPSYSSLKIMIEQKKVLVNKKNGEYFGFFIFSIEGKKCYLNCWYDESGDGFYLLFNVFALLLENGINYAYLWVNSLNRKAIKIHKILGAKPDGLKDYTFLK